MKKSTKAVSLGGVLLSLSMVTLFLATFIPGIELTLYAIASFYVAFCIIETGAKGGWLFYVASTLLGALLLPNKLAILPYAMFFGIYAIVKYYIEKIGKLPLEIVLKLLVFNIIFATGFFFFQEAFLGNIALPNLAMPFLIIGAQIMFLFYDYLFTLGLGFYLRKKPKSW